MIAFFPIATSALYVPFDSAFIYLGYLPDFYIIPELDDETGENNNLFSIGRLCLPFHRPFGIGVRKPRFIGDPYSRYMKYMGTDYHLNEVKCLNIKHPIFCWFSSRLPINQSEIEKVVVLGKLCEQVDNYNSKDSSSKDFSFSDFLIADANRSWGEYVCFAPEDQEAILSYISNPSDCQKMSFDMVPVTSFYKFSMKPNFTDSHKESFWSARLSFSSYVSLSKIYRS